MSLNKHRRSRMLHPAKVRQPIPMFGDVLNTTRLPESENADLRSTLMKRDAELGELKATWNEALRKVRNVQQCCARST